MFDNLMQNLFLNAQNKVEEEKKLLEDKIIEFSSTDGNIKIKLNANSKVLDLNISDELLKEDKEMIEDLLLINFNKAFEQANKVRDEQLEGLKEGMMPNIDDLLDNFSDFDEIVEE